MQKTSMYRILKVFNLSDNLNGSLIQVTLTKNSQTHNRGRMECHHQHLAKPLRASDLQCTAEVLCFYIYFWVLVQLCHFDHNLHVLPFFCTEISVVFCNSSPCISLFSDSSLELSQKDEKQFFSGSASLTVCLFLPTEVLKSK